MKAAKPKMWCYKCGHAGKGPYCPKCGERMRKAMGQATKTKEQS